jgi:hypothetical protein
MVRAPVMFRESGFYFRNLCSRFVGFPFVKMVGACVQDLDLSIHQRSSRRNRSGRGAHTTSRMMDANLSMEMITGVCAVLRAGGTEGAKLT